MAVPVVVAAAAKTVGSAALKEGAKHVAKEGVKQAAKEGVKKAASEGVKQAVVDGTKQTLSDSSKATMKNQMQEVVAKGRKSASPTNESVPEPRSVSGQLRDEGLSSKRNSHDVSAEPSDSADIDTSNEEELQGASSTPESTNEDNQSDSTAQFASDEEYESPAVQSEQPANTSQVQGQQGQGQSGQNAPLIDPNLGKAAAGIAGKVGGPLAGAAASIAVNAANAVADAAANAAAEAAESEANAQAAAQSAQAASNTGLAMNSKNAAAKMGGSAPSATSKKSAPPKPNPVANVAGKALGKTPVGKAAKLAGALTGKNKGGSLSKGGLLNPGKGNGGKKTPDPMSAIGGFLARRIARRVLLTAFLMLLPLILIGGCMSIVFGQAMGSSGTGGGSNDGVLESTRRGYVPIVQVNKKICVDNKKSSGESNENRDEFGKLTIGEGDIDKWAAKIDKFLEGRALHGYGKKFAEMAVKYNLDVRFQAAISMTESGGGDVCFQPYNAWGWMAALGSNSSWDETIEAHAKGLAEGYDGKLTMENAMKYCDESWYGVTGGYMMDIEEETKPGNHEGQFSTTGPSGSSGSSSSSSSSSDSSSSSSSDYSDTLIIGDSIVDGWCCGEKIKELMPGITIDTQSGRVIGGADGVLSHVKNADKKYDRYVIETGNNEGGGQGLTLQDAEEMIKSLGEDKDIYFVTMYSSHEGNTQGTLNTINTVVEKHSNVHKIDWYSLVKDHPEWVAADDAHCHPSTPEAKQKYAENLKDGLNSRTGSERVKSGEECDDKDDEEEDSGYHGGRQSLASANEAQKKVVDVALNSSNVCLTANYCLAFVQDVYDQAGCGGTRYCCAHAAMDSCDTHTDLDNIPVGAALFTGSSWGPVICGCGRDAGHIGIYIGDNKVCDNIGGRRTCTVDEWVASVQANGGTVCWGWLNNQVLTK